ncbi:unnamed protein product [Caenorhabditis auriculariae]|uniref:Uncharacterized protein n=1 Tax=Caenorhabditis auriculariae TaxID=2777116 RepID=A0A8S1GYF7_9PELO|nr:unnamed protein product [Caenorhabditis auriculariae]
MNQSERLWTTYSRRQMCSRANAPEELEEAWAVLMSANSCIADSRPWNSAWMKVQITSRGLMDTSSSFPTERENTDIRKPRTSQTTLKLMRNDSEASLAGGASLISSHFFFFFQNVPTPRVKCIRSSAVCRRVFPLDGSFSVRDRPHTGNTQTAEKPEKARKSERTRLWQSLEISSSRFQNRPRRRRGKRRQPANRSKPVAVERETIERGAAERAVGGAAERRFRPSDGKTGREKPSSQLFGNIIIIIKWERMS